MRILLLLLVLAGTAFAESLVTTDGKTYTGKVISQDPDGITLETDSGPRKVLFSRMDPKAAAEYGYDAKAAQVYQKEQAAKKVAESARQAEAQKREAPAVKKRQVAQEAKQAEDERIQKVLARRPGKRTYSLRVMQVLGDGDYLVQYDFERTTTYKVFRLIAADKNLIDNTQLEGKFYEVGTWNYTDAWGKTSTVRVLSPTASTPLPKHVEPY